MHNTTVLSNRYQPLRKVSGNLAEVLDTDGRWGNLIFYGFQNSGYIVWLRRTQLGEYRVGGIITEGGILDSIKALFEKDGTLPPSAVRSILHGFLAGISSSPLPLDNVLNPRR